MHQPRQSWKEGGKGKIWGNFPSCPLCSPSPLALPLCEILLQSSVLFLTFQCLVESYVIIKLSALSLFGTTHSTSDLLQPLASPSNPTPPHPLSQAVGIREENWENILCCWNTFLLSFKQCYNKSNLSCCDLLHSHSLDMVDNQRLLFTEINFPDYWGNKLR